MEEIWKSTSSFQYAFMICLLSLVPCLMLLTFHLFPAAYNMLYWKNMDKNTNMIFGLERLLHKEQWQMLGYFSLGRGKSGRYLWHRSVSSYVPLKKMNELFTLGDEMIYTKWKNIVFCTIMSSHLHNSLLLSSKMLHFAATVSGHLQAIFPTFFCIFNSLHCIILIFVYRFIGQTKNWPPWLY